MERKYKAFRFAYETKYWLNSLVSYYDEQLQKQLKIGLLANIEHDILNSYDLSGIALTITLNATAGSIIELALKSTQSFTLADWKILESEVEIAQKHIQSEQFPDSTPRVYLAQEAFEQLESIQNLLKEDSKRGPIYPYIIKLAVYNLYKQILG